MWGVLIKKQLPKKMLGKKGDLRMIHGSDLVKLGQMQAFMRNQYMIIDDMTNFIPPFVFDYRDAYKKLIFSRGAAIGDLVALSSPVVKMIDLGYDVTMVTEAAGFGIVDWYEKVPRKKNYNDPFITNYRFGSDHVKQYGHIDILGIIEKGERTNWYEVLYAVMNWPFSPAMGRPRLRLDRPDGEKRLNGDDLLFVVKATDSRRSIPIWTAYNCAKAAGLDKKYRLCVHRFNMKEIETEWIEMKRPNLHIIETSSKSQALLDFYDAGYVISSDTGAFHFREGVQKKALGIYGAFSTDARTKYYIYTRSFDLAKSCPKQPCFEHGSLDGNFCTENKDKLFYSPCVYDIEKQLIEMFETI